MAACIFTLLALTTFIGQTDARSPVTSAPINSPAIRTEVLTIEQGKIRGYLDKDIQVFRGIPYAAPPVGDRRWKAPEPPTPWADIRDCVNFGPACPQIFSPIMNVVPLAAIKSFSEDCLNLNIYRPANNSLTKLPVMVWIHGGGYVEGTASNELANGAELARHGVLVVTINYRLGPFGFLAHPALSAESKDQISGNYGLLDQIESLRWIKRNIQAFGGDPANVTIFGVSAGGGSVICLLVSPLAQGLFHRAIIQSAPDMTCHFLRESKQGNLAGELQGQEIMKKCGLKDSSDAAAMRRVPIDVLLNVSPTIKIMGQQASLASLKLPIEPVIDGVIIPEPPNAALAKGNFNRVPILAGFTRDEGGLFVMFAKLPAGRHDYDSMIRKEFGNFAERMLSIYPPHDEAHSIRRNAVHFMTDMIFAAEARLVARTTSLAGCNTYKYLFSRETRIPFIASAGAHHGCEVPYVFGINHPVQKWDSTDEKLCETVQQYWTNFAKTGNPNGPGLPVWPTYDSKSERALELGAKIAVIQKYRMAPLDTIDEFLNARK